MRRVYLCHFIYHIKNPLSLLDFCIINPNSIFHFIYFRLVTRDMDVSDDEETFTLIKSDTNESVNQFDTYIQDASKDNCVPVSFDFESLQITKIKMEVEAEDCSLMMRIGNETEPHYTSAIHTAHRDEPNMDDQPNNTLSLIKLMKSESSKHIVECGKRLLLVNSSHTSQLDRHMLDPECNKRFTQAGNLEQQMLTHTGDKKHVCPECDKRFARAFNLKYHMLIHTGEKQHVCPECDNRFTRTCDLKRHMLIHTGDKQHVCQECDKRFARAGYLKVHMLIHTGEKQHACPECDKRFIRVSDLKKHMV